MVNLDLYRVFYTVAKCGSLTKAAEELYISQPAVSQAVKQLENQLGGKLFNRTHKGMELSDTGGKQIFATVEKALQLLSEAETKYSELKNTATGVVRICASDTVSTHFLLKYIKEYHEKYPNVNLILQNCTSAETIELLKSNKGDIGFVNLPVDDKDVYLSNTVMQLHDTFVASDRFSELFGEVVDLKRLQDYPASHARTDHRHAAGHHQFRAFAGNTPAPRNRAGKFGTYDRTRQKRHRDSLYPAGIRHA